MGLGWGATAHRHGDSQGCAASTMLCVAQGLPAPSWPRADLFHAAHALPQAVTGVTLLARSNGCCHARECCRVRVGNGMHFDRAGKPPAADRASADLWPFGLAHICLHADSWCSAPCVRCWLQEDKMLERLGAGSNPVLPKRRHPPVSSAK